MNNNNTNMENSNTNNDNNNKKLGFFDPANISEVLRDLWRQKKNQYEWDNRVRMQKRIQFRVWDMAEQMSIELFEAFKNQTYDGLKRIDSYRNIRYFGYKSANDGYKYQFALAKEDSSKKISSVFLRRVQEQMNYDIVTIQREFIFIYGYDYLINTYPYLAYGIWVTAVEDRGMPELIITVATYITPQI